MVHLNGWLRCKDAAESETVAQYLPEHVRLTLAEPGCVRFSIEQTEDPLVWSVNETFVDAAAFAAHQARNRASDWFRATIGIQRDFPRTG
ncbi:putative quinol monooxygenase [Frigidibacter sp.]|uniref:putative quinol monooxygenase n=1 Tax=Frigidibacter sp. TaxID=2586418 RepID=UPI0027336768|nr:antibiotic biosynthesis monooxygenase [Frigidibacter sp.]MDP3342662.1 antibiotic biosynthesis monooxygenase [Frigidibacter sp.]